MRKYIEPHPNSAQLSELRTIRQLLLHRRGRSLETTKAELLKLGYETHWLRVRWIGGVGSYAIMRGGVIRVLVSATKSGYKSSTVELREIRPGVYDAIRHPGKRRGFRYGWCIQIPRRAI